MPEHQNRNGFNEPLQTIFQDFMADWVFSDCRSAQQIMDIYFTPNFSAEIDGHYLSHDMFCNRIDRMRHDAQVEEQNFTEMMETGNKLFSMHETGGRAILTASRSVIPAMPISHRAADKNMAPFREAIGFHHRNRSCL